MLPSSYKLIKVYCGCLLISEFSCRGLHLLSSLEIHGVFLSEIKFLFSLISMLDVRFVHDFIIW